MILFISNSGDILPIAYRMLQEGQRVKAYIHNPAYSDCYDNLIPKVKLRDLPATANATERVIFDMSRPNLKTKRDLALLRLFNLPSDSKSIFGPVADKLRKRGVNVIGQSKWTENMELDRKLGSDIAKKLGFSLPVTYDFNKLSEAVDFLSSKRTMWVFKPHENADLDMTYVEQYPGELYYKLQNDFRERIGRDKFKFMLQKKMDGTALSTESWFDGEKFTCTTHTYEDKTLMNAGCGPHIGSQSNTVWSIPGRMREDIVSKLEGLVPLLREAGYKGPIDVNCLVASKNNVPYFLEWTPRMGFDALYCLTSLLKTSCTELFRFRGSIDDRRWAASQRISIPPYPYEAGDLLDMAKNVEVQAKPKDMFFTDVKWVDGGLQCAGGDGIIGSTVQTGYSVGEAVNNVLTQAEQIKVGSQKQYRTDHKENFYAAYEQLFGEKVGTRTV